MKEDKRIFRFDYKRSLWRHVRIDQEGKRTLRMAWIKKCHQCGKEQLHASPNFKHCNECKEPRYKLLASISGKAHGAVTQAIRDGILPPLMGQIFCADCGKPAQCYDHRDYDKPLEVAAVCFSCNVLRGPAKQHEAIVLKFPKQFKKSAHSGSVR